MFEQLLAYCADFIPLRASLLFFTMHASCEYTIAAWCLRSQGSPRLDCRHRATAARSGELGAALPNIVGRNRSKAKGKENQDLQRRADLKIVGAQQINLRLYDSEIKVAVSASWPSLTDKQMQFASCHIPNGTNLAFQRRDASPTVLHIPNAECQSAQESMILPLIFKGCGVGGLGSTPCSSGIARRALPAHGGRFS